jgi:hypothetical protein
MTMAFARPLAEGGVCDTSRDAQRASAISLTACVGVCVLIVTMPFEAVVPLVTLPAQSVSSAEAVLLAVLAGWMIACARGGAWPRWRTPLTAPWMLWIAFSVAAAATAPVFRANAMAMSARLALALVVLVLAVHGTTSWRRMGVFGLTAAVAGALLSGLVIADYFGVDFVRQRLEVFRTGVALVGAQVRASGPFQYPTIASMYLEILFALALPLFVLALDRRRRLWACAAAAALLLMAQANALTFTRAGLVTMVASLAIVAWFRYRRRGVDVVVGALALIAVVIAAQFLGSRSLESVALRLTSEGQDAWYQTWIDAPARVQLATGTVSTVPVTLTNTGRVTWDSTLPQPFRVSSHWLTEDGNQVVSWEGRRTSFPKPVPPGTSVMLQVEVEAPRQPGEYRLMWDVELQHRLWFSTEPGAARFVSAARVSGSTLGGLGPLQPLPRPIQHGSVRPSRVALWRAAARMSLAHPWLGVGPDNYRLRYGSYLGLAESDTRIHSNNMYLEVLTGSGLLGAVAVSLLIWRICALAARIFRRISPSAVGGDAMSSDASMLSAGVVAAVAAIGLHGLVDSFLSFTATYVLIAIALGLMVAGESLSRPHAYRV